MIEQQNWLVVNVSIMMAAQNATDFMHPEEQVLVDPFSWPSAHTPDPREAFLPFETCILPSPNCTAEHSPNLSGGLCFALFLAWAFYSFFFTNHERGVRRRHQFGVGNGEFSKNDQERERERNRERAMGFQLFIFAQLFLGGDLDKLVLLLLSRGSEAQRFRKEMRCSRQEKRERMRALVLILPRGLRSRLFLSLETPKKSQVQTK